MSFARALQSNEPTVWFQHACHMSSHRFIFNAPTMVHPSHASAAVRQSKCAPLVVTFSVHQTHNVHAFKQAESDLKQASPADPLRVHGALRRKALQRWWTSHGRRLQLGPPIQQAMALLKSCPIWESSLQASRCCHTLLALVCCDLSAASPRTEAVKMTGSFKA